MTQHASPQYYPALDGLRGIAVLMVIAFHLGWLGAGWAGVGLFFVLSGFLITKNLLQWSEELPLRTYLGRFYWRRALRILPLYFAVIAIFGGIYLLSGKPAWLPDHLPFLLTFCYNFFIAQTWELHEAILHPLWSISTEEQFYLFWPMVVFVLGRKYLVHFAIVLILMSPLIRLSIFACADAAEVSNFSWTWVYYLPFGHGDAFALGAMVAIFHQKIGKKSAKKIVKIAVVPAVVIVVVSILGLGIDKSSSRFYYLGFNLTETDYHWHVWGYSVLYLAFGGMILWAMHGEANAIYVRFLTNRQLKYIGKISYGIYIFHWPMMLLFQKFGAFDVFQLTDIPYAILYLGLVIGLAHFSFKYFESYFLNQKERYFFNPKL